MLVIMVHIYYDIPHNGSRKIPILLYVPFMYPICGLFSITHQHPTYVKHQNHYLYLCDNYKHIYQYHEVWNALFKSCFYLFLYV